MRNKKDYRDSYMFQGVIPKAEESACDLKTTVRHTKKDKNR